MMVVHCEHCHWNDCVHSSSLQTEFILYAVNMHVGYNAAIARFNGLSVCVCLSVGHDCEPRRSNCKKGKGSPYSITEHRVLEPIPVLGSQPAGDVSHKPGGRLPLLSTRPAVTLAILKRVATNFAAW